MGRQKVGALQGLACFLVSWPHSPSRSCHLLEVPWLRNDPSLIPATPPRCPHSGTKREWSPGPACFQRRAGQGSVTRQALVVATVSGGPSWGAELLTGKMGEPESPAPPVPQAAPGLLDSHSVSLPPYCWFWEDGLAHLAARCVGVCCLATNKGIPRARQRED